MKVKFVEKVIFKVKTAGEDDANEGKFNQDVADKGVDGVDFDEEAPRNVETLQAGSAHHQTA